MTEEPSVLVDSNVIIDIVQQDERWAEWSLDALSRGEGASVNPVIYAELCYQHTSCAEVDQLLRSLELGYHTLPREALYLAAQAYRTYRKAGGTKTSPLPDFFIGQMSRQQRPGIGDDVGDEMRSIGERFEVACD